MGGKSTSTSAPRLNQLSIQTSTLGLPLTIGWGRNRVKCNLIWYNAFTAIPHTTKTGGGKGLTGGSKNTTYTYTASFILAIGEGGASGIGGINTVWKDNAVFAGGGALAAVGLSLATGTPTQSTWGYLTSRYPSQASNYSGIAYVYAQDYQLGDQGSLPNHSLEVDWGIQLGGGVHDADPKDIVTDFLTNAAYGVPGWPSGMLGDLSDYSLYCRANNLLLSPALESQTTASSIMDEWFKATNSAPFWSEGLLKVRPYGDAAATGNSVTWTPNLTPAYDLTESDLVPTDDGCPVSLTINDQSDAYNIVQVEFLDRANSYNVGIAVASDLANVVEFGPRRQDPTTMHCICDAAVARTSAELLKNRTLYIREDANFRLPWNFVLLEPTDLVTLTTTSDELQLNRLLVRIKQIDEDAEGLLSFIGEVLEVGTASAATYSSHSGTAFTPNTEIAPGSVSTPALFDGPTDLTGFDPEVWLAAGSTSLTWGGCEVWLSTDGTSYSRIGVINGPARYGTTTGSLATHVDPDNTNSVGVDLSTSLGQLISVSAADKDAAATLAWLGSELISYQTATLTSANNYTLSGLRRGLHATTPAAHSSGVSFVRLDDAVFKFGYGALNVGDTIYVKLPSFNQFGRGLQLLSAVTAYSFTLGSGSSRYDDVIDDIVSISSDSILSAGSEKQKAIIDYNALIAQYNAIKAQYISLGSPAGATTAYNDATTATGTLTTYLGSLSPAWNTTTVDSPISATTWTTDWNDAYNKVAIFASAITGGVGAAGYSNARILLYQRAASAPAVPSGTLTYNFSSDSFTAGSLGSWSRTVPAVDGNPLYATVASAFSNTATDTIATGEWTTPVVIVVDGAASTPGINSATVFLYQRATSAPAVPSGTLTYTFSTGVIAGATLGSWTQSVPTSGTNPIYVTTATAANTTATDAIGTGEWATPAILAQNGTNGVNALVGLLTNENQTLPADAAGNVTTYSGATGNFQIFSGSTDVSSSFGLSTPTGGNPQALTVGYSFQTFTVSGGFDASEANATLIIRATGTGAFSGITIDKTFTLSKSSAGATGAAPPLITLTTTSQQVRYDTTNTFVAGQTITLTTVRQNSSTTPIFSVYDASGTLLTSATAAALSSSSPTYFTTSGVDNLVLSSVFLAGYSTISIEVAIGSVKDRVSLVKVQDGASGASTVNLIPNGPVAVGPPNTVKKTGTANAWDNVTYSAEGYTGDCIAIVRIPSGSSELFFGLRLSPVSTDSYYNTDYAYYFSGGVGYANFNPDSTAHAAAYSAGDFMCVRRRGTTIEFGPLGGTPIFTRTGVSATAKVYFECCIATPNAVLDQISFQQVGKDGVSALKGVVMPDSITVPCTAGGTPKGTIPSATFTATQAGVDVTASLSIGTVTSVGVSGASVASGVVSITGMSADTGSVSFPISFGGATDTITVTFTKSKDGAAFVTGSTGIGLPTTSYTEVAYVDLLMGPSGTVSFDLNGNFTQSGGGTANMQGYVEYSLNGGGTYSASGAGTFTGNASLTSTPGDFAQSGTISGGTMGLSTKQTVRVHLMMRKTGGASVPTLTGNLNVSWTG